MPTLDLLVSLAGLAAIIWVNWYFFFAERGVVAAGTSREVVIVVHGGYEPGTVKVKAGQPVRLVFDRRESSGCSGEIVFPELGVRRFLPAFERTTIELTPPAPGVYEFTCGMSMLRGKVVAE